MSDIALQLKSDPLGKTAYNAWIIIKLAFELSLLTNTQGEFSYGFKKEHIASNIS